MNISIQNDIKVIEMGDKGPNLLSVDRADRIISELNKKDCKAVILLGNEKVFSAGLNLKHLQKAKDADEVSLIFKTLRNLSHKKTINFHKDLKRPPDEKSALELRAKCLNKYNTVLANDYYASLRASYTYKELKDFTLKNNLLSLEVFEDDTQYLIVYGNV